MHWAMPQRSTPALPEGEHKELGSESHDIKDQKGQDEEEVSVTCRDQDVSSSLTSLEDFRKGNLACYQPKTRVSLLGVMIDHTLR